MTNKQKAGGVEYEPSGSRASLKDAAQRIFTKTDTITGLLNSEAHVYQEFCLFGVEILMASTLSLNVKCKLVPCLRKSELYYEMYDPLVQTVNLLEKLVHFPFKNFVILQFLVEQHNLKILKRFSFQAERDEVLIALWSHLFVVVIAMQDPPPLPLG